MATPPNLTINRVTYSLNSFNQQFRRFSQLVDSHEDGLRLPDSHAQNQVKLKLCHLVKVSLRCLFNVNPLTVCKRYVPAIKWLSEYKKSDLAPDLVTGLTIAVFHVPESMGYSFLANVNPIYCLYTGFFPNLIYALMGTSSYCSIGTFAALSIMIGSIIKEAKLEIQNDHSNFGNSSTTWLGSLFEFDSSLNAVTNSEIAFTCAFIAGFYQLVFGLLRLGFISVYMSEQFLNGFTCAVAFHVLFSQIQYILGLSISESSEEKTTFKLLNFIYSMMINFDKSNIAAIVISIVSAILIVISKWVIDPWVHKHKKIHVSFPIEFILVISSVILFKLMNLSKLYHIQVIGPIIPGLPNLSVPRFVALFRYLWQPCISVAVVSYSVTFSTGRTLANQASSKNNSTSSKQSYQPVNQIDASQELVALGTCNLVGSFFACIPSGASLSRSAIQLNSGGRTQLVSIINSSIILCILYLSSFFETLPEAILATIISFALRDLLLNVKKLAMFWKVSRVDASVWLVTFVSVLLIGMNWGLYLGLLYSLVTLIYKSQVPHTYLLGAVHSSAHGSMDIFVPVEQYVSAHQLPGIKIFQFCGPLHFANINYFITQLECKLQFSIQNLIGIKLKISQLLNENALYNNSQYNPSAPETNSSEMLTNLRYSPQEDTVTSKNIKTTMECGTRSKSTVPINDKKYIFRKMLSGYHRYLQDLLPTHLVIDCSLFSYIDSDGIKMLQRVINDLEFLGVKVLLGGCASHVGRLLQNLQIQAGQEEKQLIYITVADAIEQARLEQCHQRTTALLSSDCRLYSLSDTSMDQPWRVDVSEVRANSVKQQSQQQTTTNSSSLVGSTSLSLSDSAINQLTVPVIIEMHDDYCQMIPYENQCKHIDSDDASDRDVISPLE